MKIVIQGHSRAEVRRYRLVKGVLGIALLPLAWTYLQRPAPTPRRLMIARAPVVTTDEAMRDDFPLEWSVKAAGPLRKMGKHEVEGEGPRNVGVLLYQGDELVGRSRTDSTGRWKALVTLDHPGLLSFRAEFRRQSVVAGRSKALGATVFDPNAKGKTDISITNLRAKDRVVAGSFTLRGSAPAGDFVQVYIDATLLGRAEVDLAGRWEFKPKISRGGRRTFTIVDEITQRQFGPLVVFVVGKVGPAAKPAPKPVATKGKSGSAPVKTHPPIKGAPGAKPAAQKWKPKKPAATKPIGKPHAKTISRAKPTIHVVPSKGLARPALKPMPRKKPLPAKKLASGWGSVTPVSRSSAAGQ